jgi:methylenetetrahydrofolate dehydrogenase (NADP+)/methenyltetrahydrofolate cyclohydrolase
MTAHGKIIDGKAIALEVESAVKSRVRKLSAQGVVAGLATILVGANQASQMSSG